MRREIFFSRLLHLWCRPFWCWREDADRQSDRLKLTTELCRPVGCEQQRRYQSLEWGWWPIPIQGHIKECECSSTNRDAGGQGHWLRDLVISGLMWSTMESSHKSTMSLCDLQLEAYKPGAMWTGWEHCTDTLAHAHGHWIGHIHTRSQEVWDLIKEIILLLLCVFVLSNFHLVSLIFLLYGLP